MKEIKFTKKSLKVLCTGTILASVIFSGAVYAADTELKLNTTDEYNSWNNLTLDEKEYTIMPKTFDAEIPESILKEYESDNIPNMLSQLLGNSSGNLENVSATINDSRYTLSSNLNMRVEHQGSTTECWAFSLLKSVETNKALKEGVTELADFSERHMDYATSRTFLDGTNEDGFNREVGNGGLLIVGLAYLTNGQGAVKESDMPFEDSETKINLEEIDKDVDTIINDYYTLPSIHKEYTKDSNGNTISVKYMKADGTEYTASEVNAIRNIYKSQLVNNGAIASMTGGNMAKFYNNTAVFSATAYNCNDSSKVRDHAITIVGWDDNYSRDNFAEGTKPSTDGAYIVLNSYGEESFDNGYIYISYEDYFIEAELYGVGSTSNVNYDNLYQYDYYGGIYEVGTTATNEGYYAVTYDRDNISDEALKSVGVTLSDYASLEIYVNAKDSSLEKDKLVRVATTDVLEPGYHRIDIVPTQLTGDNFSIVVKQKSQNNKFYFEIETKVDGTAYALVDSEHRSYMSLDGNTWSNLSSLDVTGIDMSSSDVCIKAFTNNEVIETVVSTIELEEYIVLNNDIMNIHYETTKEELLKNIKSNGEIKIYQADGIEVTDNEIIKTGMKLVLEDQTEYTLVVRGDINLDGKVTLTDLSKLILHYNGVRGFELEDAGLKGADLNCDGTVNLVDVSQMLLLYNSI